MNALSLGLAWILAAATPQPAADDRVRIIDYDPAKVVVLSGAPRTATQIQFGEAEAILHVAVGDAAGWEIAVEDNVLFLKPKAGAAARTNLIVTTRWPQGRRHYLFDLGLQPARGKTALYALRFRYPADQAAASQVALDAVAAALERRLLELKLDRAVVEGPRNLAYGLRGAAALDPSEVSDNGRFTVLRFPANQPLPTLYQVADDGQEMLVPFDVRGEFVVVHAVVRELRLRRGEALLCILNQAFDARGVNSGTGTAAADVQRTDKAPRP